RQADRLDVALPSAHNTARGTLVIETDMPTLTGYTTDRAIAALFGDANNMMRFAHVGSNHEVRVTESSVAILTDTTAFAAGVHRAALAYQAGSYRSAQDGATVVSASGAGLTPQNAYHIGHVNNTQPLFGWVRRVTYYPSALPNATLQGLTRL
ncbi:MAG: hypothetical protein EB121_03690, partial [Alphaproteobacteria bacterium]|nr:hypothetical protein [Alphaproteobacteria bacterium]